MSKTDDQPKVLNRRRYGYAIEWPNGYISAMPDRSTAYSAAAASVLLAALEEARLQMEQMSGMFDDADGAIAGAIADATAAINKAKGQ